MKLSTTILGLVASNLAATQACLVLNGAYYKDFNKLMVTLTDNGVQYCSFVDTFTTSEVFLNCADGHYAWIRRPEGGGGQTEGWIAAYAYGGRDYLFGVDASRIIVRWGNTEVGLKLHAANYGC